MANSLLRTDKEITEIYERHKKTVYRVCFAYMKNQPDTEEALQDTFYQLIRKGPVFESEEQLSKASFRTYMVIKNWGLGIISASPFSSPNARLASSCNFDNTLS